MKSGSNATMTRRGFVATLGGSLGAAFLAGCAGKQDQATSTDSQAGTTQESGTPASEGIDYMVLVNKWHKLPDNWEDVVSIVQFKNTEGWDVQVEAKAYDAYLAMKDELSQEDVYVDLDSAFRGVKEQQRIVDDFTKKYGAEYVKQYVAVPGYSEHHTGLALDLFLIIDGKGVYENEDMVTYPEIWEKIHAKLADHGFILRYLPQRKVFTGASYEPWHIRYLDDPEVAHQIMDAGLTLEEYLNEVEPIVAGCEVDYGNSKLYEDTDLDRALDAILAEFGTWKGCTLKRYAFTSDEQCTQNLAYANELREANMPDIPAFDQAIVLATDFHSPSEEEAKGTAWEPDTDYHDWTWTLGRTGADGMWQLVGWGMG